MTHPLLLTPLHLAASLNLRRIAMMLLRAGTVLGYVKIVACHTRAVLLHRARGVNPVRFQPRRNASPTLTRPDSNSSHGRG